MADVVILCGGLGTRLRSVVSDRPKPMADVGGRPFLEFLIDKAAPQGFRRFILCVGYGASAIRDHFARRTDLEIAFSEEPEPLGTGGALKLCEPLCREAEFLLINGDSYCPLDLNSLLSARGKGIGIMAAAPAGGRKDGGLAELDGDRIVRFTEKGEASDRDWLNAGIFALSRSVFDAIPSGRACSFEIEVVPKLLPMGLRAFKCPGPVYDIGTPERLEAFRRVVSSL